MLNLRTLPPKCLSLFPATVPQLSHRLLSRTNLFATIPKTRGFLTASSRRTLGRLLAEGFKDYFPKPAPKSSRRLGEPKESKESKEPKEPQQPLGGWGAAAAVAGLLVGMWFFTSSTRPNVPEITFTKFVTDYLDQGRVGYLSITPTKDQVYIHLKKPGNDPETGNISPSGAEPVAVMNIGSVDSFERSLAAAQGDVDPTEAIPVKYVREPPWRFALEHATPLLFAIGSLALFFYITNRQMGPMVGGGKGKNIFSIGKSPATVIRPGDKTHVTFADVAGLDEAKLEITEFVEFLKSPDKFKALGAKIPKGALLVGPPGTGKTLLAKATAGEANVPFYSITGSDFIEMFVGVGPSRVRDLFAKARADAPCIIWIDEIDAVGRKRSKGGFGGGHDERESTLNQLLVEMDGFQTNDSVVVLAGTNRKDILDRALLRPGRFDRMVNITLPDIKGRGQIFKVHLAKIKLDLPLDEVAHRLAALTPGFSGADIANICNEAAILAARHDHKSVELRDFELAVDRVIGGLEKKHSAMTLSEKKLVAYHESGHAVAGWFLEHADPLLKVTVVPRSNGALGFAQYLPKELMLYQTDQLSDMMVMTLAGRAAEQVFFGKISTGAADDLKKLTNIAQAQVTRYGMSSRVGQVSYDTDEERFTKPFSEATSRIIDEEVASMTSLAYQRAIKLIEEKKELVEKLAKKLLEVETVNHDALVEILGPRPHQNESYKEYVKHAVNRPKQEKDKNEKQETDEGPSILSPAPA